MGVFGRHAASNVVLSFSLDVAHKFRRRVAATCAYGGA
jgi:hypothetical protein